MEGQIQWTISIVMVALFSVAIIGFAMHFASDNNTPINIANDPQLSGTYTSIGGNLTEFSPSAQSTYNTTLSSSVTTGFTTQQAGQYALTFGSLFGILTSVMDLTYSKIFGNNPEFQIFILSFLALAVFITIMLLIKTWLGRSPN